MRIALLYPIVSALVEKIASLFPDDGITVIGPLPDEMYIWDPRILPLAKLSNRIKEWNSVGLDIRLIESPFSECDFSQFDVLIESVETFNYSADWINHCERVECPIVTKVCWVNNPAALPEGYVRRMREFPMLVEMPAHMEVWKQSDFKDVSLALEPCGDWWFDRPYTGQREEILFVLAGKGLWRPADDTVCGLDWWDKICAAFPGRVRHQDGAQQFRTAKEMTALYSGSRVFVNLDRHDARPLAVSYIEALCAGMPVAARKHYTLSYGDFIDTNGICTESFDDMCSFLDRCLSDIEYARSCGRRSREIGRNNFSMKAVKPAYASAIQRAQEVFRSGRWK